MDDLRLRATTARDDPIRRAQERGRRIDDEIRGEIRDGRLDRGISLDALAQRTGMSAARISRLERGLLRLDLPTASVLLAGVGKELSVRAYPAGPPVRDAAHAALLSRLRTSLAPQLTWQTEVPLPAVGDLRAWDAVISCPGCRPPWRMPVEAETRPRDGQALERRLALKMRDASVESVLLVLSDTRHNRMFLRVHGGSLAARFPVSSRDALAALGAGRHPGGGAIILL